MAMFTATEKRNLTKLLARESNQVVTSEEEVSQREVNQREVRTLDGLHGFLFGLAITPELVLPGEWLPVIFGEGGPPIDDKKVGYRLLENLFLASNRIAQENQDGVLSFPFCDPIKSKEVQRIQNWTNGLYLAISLRPEIWVKSYTVKAKSSEPYESISGIRGLGSNGT